MTFFNSNGFNINYERFDGCSLENTLFIHGNLACNEWWHPTIEILKSEAMGSSLPKSILCADWRGFGESRGLSDKSEIDFDIFAQDYINLALELDFKDINIIGHSTGGLIAMKAVSLRPDLFKSLVLLDSVSAKGIELQFPLEQTLEHFKKMAIDKAYCKMVLAATINGVDQDSSLFLRLLDKTLACDDIMWTGVIEKLSSGIDIVDQIKKLNLPTLILHGDQDLVLPLEGSRYLDSLFPNSHFKILKGQGHSFCIENPQSFVDELKSFWGSFYN